MSVSRAREKRMHGLTGGGWKRTRPPRTAPAPGPTELRDLGGSLVRTPDTLTIRLPVTTRAVGHDSAPLAAAPPHPEDGSGDASGSAASPGARSPRRSRSASSR